MRDERSLTIADSNLFVAGTEKIKFTGGGITEIIIERLRKPLRKANRRTTLIARQQVTLPCFDITKCLPQILDSESDLTTIHHHFYPYVRNVPSYFYTMASL